MWKQGLLLFCLIFVVQVMAQDELSFFNKAYDLQKNGKFDKAITFLEQQIQKSDLSKDSKDLVKFNIAYLNLISNNLDKAAEGFQILFKEQTNLEDYAGYYLSKVFFQQKKFNEAEEVLKKIQNLNPNVKLKNEALQLLGEISLEKKNFKQARMHFRVLERKSRGTDQYPEVIYHLGVSERGVMNNSGFCQWMIKLYERYPFHDRVKAWGPDLVENKILGEKTQCRASIDNFKTRMRSLMQVGLDQKAKQEVEILRANVKNENPYLSDELLAQFYVLEGEAVKAAELLKPHYAERKRNFDFLIQYASLSARAGSVQASVGSYYAAYKLNPKAKKAKQALYQSAFLSYQFQDYDGAARRFREFMKVYPTSGLTKDAKWHLAWLKYLKGDFSGAFQEMSKLLDAKGRLRPQGITKDRLTYWRGMSLFRLGQIEQAKNIFENLAADRLLGYYSIAAQYRLNKIKAMMPLQIAKNPNRQKRSIARFTINEFLMSSVDEKVIPSSLEEMENEENLEVNLGSTQEEEKEGEEAQVDITAETGHSEVATEVETIEIATDIKDPKLVKKFEKARDLMILKFYDWAKWDLYEIERKTKNREYLRTLMAEYSSIEQFHRSSYISHTFFSRSRSSQGIDGIRFLWEFAYPQAYSDYVLKYSDKFEVPKELVWGIIKAESQYRKDAISPVGALGLMQVMPVTGHKVAQLLGENDFSAEQLLGADSAIRLGTRYLQRLQKTFDQSIPLVAAAYNAGPHRVKNWLYLFGNLEMDEFVEHIPFLETRNYVKKVISNAYVYNQLYSDSKSLIGGLSESIDIKVTEVSTKENWDDI